MSLLRDIFTTKSNGVPKKYTKQMKVGKRFGIVKGQLNKLRVRPNILNEHVESSREDMGIVTPTNIIGQVFKASQDNIDSLLLTLESAAGGIIDTFEAYPDSAALQLAWVAGGTNSATLETIIVKEGGKSMALPGDISNDSWVKTLGAPTDYTDFTFSFWWRQDKEYNRLKYEFTLSDGVDTLSFPLVVALKDNWYKIFVDINAMVDTGATDMTAITTIGFRVVDKEGGFQAYVDDIEATQPPGTVGLKLWHCGNTLPVADGASFDLATNATQIEEIGDWGIDGVVVAERTLQLKGGKRLYHIEDFAIGNAPEHPNNDIMVVGDYYALTINYLDTNVSVYGPNTTYSYKYYTNGYAFYTSAENVDITVISGVFGNGAYSDLMFGIFSVQDVYLFEYHLHFSNASGQSVSTGREAYWITLVEDINMIISDITTAHGGHVVTDGDYYESFDWRPILMSKGGKFEVYYNDDFTDGVLEVELEYFYLYIPPEING